MEEGEAFDLHGMDEIFDERQFRFFEADQAPLAEAEFDQPALGGFGGGWPGAEKGGGKDPLGQVVDTAESPASGDEHAPVDHELFQDRLDGSAGGAPGRGGLLLVFDVVGGEGPPLGDFADDALGEALLGGGEFAGKAVALILPQLRARHEVGPDSQR